MFPIGALIFAISAAARAARNGQNPPAAVTGPLSRASVGFFVGSGAGMTLIIQLVLFPAFVGSLITGLSTGNPFSLAQAVICGTLVLPWLLCRWVLIPLGLSRLTHWVANLSRVTWRNDKPGGPAFGAALALVHQHRPRAKSIAWVEGRLGESGLPLQGSTVAAWGLLAAARGDLPAARRLLQSVRLLDKRVVAPVVSRRCAEWLATDAAVDGDWETVRKITAQKEWGSSRILWLLKALALTLLADPQAPGRLGLWIYWGVAPRRLFTWRFVRAVGQRPPVPRVVDAGGSERRGSLEAALDRHLCLPSKPRLQALSSVAHGWDLALSSDALVSRLSERAAALGGGDTAAILERLRETIEETLGTQAQRGVGKVSAPSPLLDRALQRRRDGLLEALEQQMGLMDARKQEKRELPLLDEWRDLAKIHAQYDALVALGGLEERRLAHSVIRDRLVNFGVWFFNLREQKPMANAIFNFLLAEATALGDEGAATLNRKNAGCGI